MGVHIEIISRLKNVERLAGKIENCCENKMKMWEQGKQSEKEKKTSNNLFRPLKTTKKVTNALESNSFENFMESDEGNDLGN